MTFVNMANKTVSSTNITILLSGRIALYVHSLVYGKIGWGQNASLGSSLSVFLMEDVTSLYLILLPVQQEVKDLQNVVRVELHVSEFMC